MSRTACSGGQPGLLILLYFFFFCNWIRCIPPPPEEGGGWESESRPCRARIRPAAELDGRQDRAYHRHRADEVQDRDDEPRLQYPLRSSGWRLRPLEQLPGSSTGSRMDLEAFPDVRMFRGPFSKKG